MIKHNSPSINKSYLKSVNKQIISNQLTTGEVVKKVENYFNKKYYKYGYSCLTSSGTSAIYLAIKALSKKKKNLKILIPTYSCSAILNAIYLSGNIPIINDIDPNSFNLDLKSKKNIDMIIAVNIFGSDPNLKELKILYPKAKIILDSCHSTGKLILKDDPCFFADIVIHSFYSTKIITSGHGGLIWSKNKKIIDFCNDYINFDQKKKYIQRFNFLISDFQAALLYEQIKFLNKFRKFRKKNYLKYKASLSRSIKIFSNFNLKKDIIYRSVLIFKNKFIRDKFLNYMKKNKVECIIPIENYELLHNYLKLNKTKYKNSEKISNITLSLPMHHNLSRKDVNRISLLVNRFV